MNDKAPLKNNKRRSRNARRRPSAPKEPILNLEKLEELAGPQLFNTICTAKVVSVNGEVSVAVEGLAKEGEAVAKIPSEEFADKKPEVGSEIKIYLDDPPKTKEDGSHDLAIASVAKAAELAEYEKLEEAVKSKSFVKGMIVSSIKGGYSVALFVENQQEAQKGAGLRAFLPHRQAGFSAKDQPSIFSAEPYEFTILEISKGGGGIIVTRREILSQERKAKKKEFWENVKVGDVVEGVVRNILPYGAFVEVSGADGLLHASDLVWHKQPRPEDIIKVGQVLTLMVIEADLEKKKLKLGLKQMVPDPWESIRENFQTGMEVEGIVVAIADFGVFVQLKEGIEGLVHLSEMSWQRLKHPSQKFNIGDTVKARILSLDQGHHRISLSTKALETNPIERIAEKYPAGTVLKTKVVQVKEFGVFVQLDEDVVGLVHIGELSWTKRIDNPEEIYSEGQEIEVVVLGFDPERQRVSCSVKRLTDDPWAQWKEKYAKGTRHKVVVKKVVNSGAECELEPDLIAFCPTRELSTEGADRAQDVVKVGQELNVEITNCDPQHQKISLSVKVRSEKETREDYQQYLEKQNESGGGTATMADVAKSNPRSKDV